MPADTDCSTQDHCPRPIVIWTVLQFKFFCSNDAFRILFQRISMLGQWSSDVFRVCGVICFTLDTSSWTMKVRRLHILTPKETYICSICNCFYMFLSIWGPPVGMPQQLYRLHSGISLHSTLGCWGWRNLWWTWSQVLHLPEYQLRRSVKEADHATDAVHLTLRPRTVGAALSMSTSRRCQSHCSVERRPSATWQCNVLVCSQHNAPPLSCAEAETTSWKVLSGLRQQWERWRWKHRILAALSLVCKVLYRGYKMAWWFWIMFQKARFRFRVHHHCSIGKAGKVV